MAFDCAFSVYGFFGRPAIDQEKLNLAMRMYDSKNCTIAEITKATGVSKATLYQYLSKRKK